jgi:hypothetical protein
MLSKLSLDLKYIIHIPSIGQQWNLERLIIQFFIQILQNAWMIKFYHVNFS